ncbi:MAG: GH32 C-terminal domain-containing protein, partial [Verrucomicrobia bacterium]|nr:GH32 C-terminal domain-containing protein [Verrucomicrobiota bacterium]
AHPTNDIKEDVRLSVGTNHINFVYYGLNPVISTPDVLFRDPHVFWHEESGKWIMVVARSIERILRFYSSPDLKTWTQLSEFGPIGGRQEIWEVPGLARLPVKGLDVSKWVLFTGLGPNKEQFYVGDFNGTNFILDATSQSYFSVGNGLNGEVFEDFEEANWAATGWTVNGSGGAFGPGPDLGVHDASGYIGNLLANSAWNDDWRVDSYLLSPPFTITKKFINFLVGGGDHPGQTCINLLVDSLVVRTTTGDDSNILKWSGWDVRTLVGQTAQIQIVDSYGGFWGRIYVDHIVFSDTLIDTDQEHSRWIDWGSDFYGSRIFQDYDDTNSAPVWMGWMGNWAYATNVPTPWQGGGGQTLPRLVELEACPGGYQIVQTPHPNFQRLRGAPVHVGPRKVEGDEYFGAFHPTENTYELEAVFNIHDPNQRFGLNVCSGSASTNGFEKTVIGYDVATANIFLDRRFSGDVSFHPDFATIENVPFPAAEGYIKFHVFVDKSAIEVFVNDGKRVLTSVIFPHPDNRAIELFSDNGPTTLRRFTAWPMGAAH